MSQPESEQPLASDPLLEFSIEPGAKPDDTPAKSTNMPDARIDRVECSVDQLVDKVASLKTEVATLVGAIDDIKKRLSRRPAIVPLPPRATMTRSVSRSASAIAGVILGVAVATLGWTRWSHDSIDAIAPATTLAAATPVATESAPPPTAPLPIETPPPEAPKQIPERVTPRLVQASAHVDYVGTLSIDAAPAGEVFINRQTAGRTPLKVSNLRAGSHLVWIERDGYRRWTKVVEVPADRVTRLSAALEPIASR